MSKVIWLTGLSGAGKTTIARELKAHFTPNAVILDGDEWRSGVCSDLGFSVKDRTINLKRAAHMAELLHDQGFDVIVSFISPQKCHRDYARKLLKQDFIEVYVKASLEECEKRDPKGLYKKARAGEIKNFTGISADYCPPNGDAVVLDTEQYSPHRCAKLLYNIYTG